MRNMLDDLTRPAAPVGLTAQIEGKRVLVQISPSVDPRTLGFVAGVRAGDRWVRLCHGALRCAGIEPPGSGPITVGVVTVDLWRRRSAAAFAVVQR
jgi:hypothetical protein